MTTNQSTIQLDRSRLAVACLRALHVQRDEKLANEIIDQITDFPAFVRGLEAVACAALSTITAIDRETHNGITGEGVLNHLTGSACSRGWHRPRTA